MYIYIYMFVIHVLCSSRTLKLHPVEPPSGKITCAYFEIIVGTMITLLHPVEPSSGKITCAILVPPRTSLFKHRKPVLTLKL